MINDTNVETTCVGDANSDDIVGTSVEIFDVEGDHVDESDVNVSQIDIFDPRCWN
ncbi:hypothetical protein Tco_0515865, partial [Tanacetum coccineum]